jgi:hypothetical protein
LPLRLALWDRCTPTLLHDREHHGRELRLAAAIAKLVDDHGGDLAAHRGLTADPDRVRVVIKPPERVGVKP